jgi:hypothetical protein
VVVVAVGAGETESAVNVELAGHGVSGHCTHVRKSGIVPSPWQRCTHFRRQRCTCQEHYVSFCLWLVKDVQSRGTYATTSPVKR